MKLARPINFEVNSKDLESQNRIHSIQFWDPFLTTLKKQKPVFNPEDRIGRVVVSDEPQKASDMFPSPRHTAFFIGATHVTCDGCLLSKLPKRLTRPYRVRFGAIS